MSNLCRCLIYSLNGVTNGDTILNLVEIGQHISSPTPLRQKKSNRVQPLIEDTQVLQHDARVLIIWICCPTQKEI